MRHGFHPSRSRRPEGRRWSFQSEAVHCCHARSFRVARIPPVDNETWTTASTHQTFAAGSFSFEDKRWRLNILVEGLRRIGKAALGVGPVVELHRDVEHHKIR